MGLTFWKVVLAGVIVAVIGIIITAIGTPLGDVLKELGWKLIAIVKELGRRLIAIVNERLGRGNDVRDVSGTFTDSFPFLLLRNFHFGFG